MSNDFIPLSVPSLGGNELKYVSECIETEWVSSAGSYVDEFEKRSAEVAGSKYAVACVNGTSALHIALILSGVTHDDEVIVPTLTFIAPINVVKYVDAYPVFMDCDDHLNIDVDKVARFCEKECRFEDGVLINKQSGRTVRVIMPVHVFGHPINIEPLKETADRFNLKIIEDATESLGSCYKGGRYDAKKTGTIGYAGCLSFNGNKIVTTGGGGMIVTDDRNAALRAKYLTTQAKNDSEKFVHDEVGYNYRLTNVQAAIGCAQLEKLGEYIETKRRNFALYKEYLNDINGIQLVREPDFGYSNYWHYTIVIDPERYGMSSEQLRHKLKENNVESRHIWELNHRQKPYRDCQAYEVEKAVKYHRNCLNLPCSVNIDEGSIKKICDIIGE